jgi:hypothetical protein
MILVPVKAFTEAVVPLRALATREVELCARDADEADKQRIRRLDADGGKKT